MSSFSNTKKRKGGAVCVGGDGGTVAAGLNDTIAEMKVHMTRIQNEMETRIVSMQNEMDIRATLTNSLQNEVDGMKSRCQFLETRVWIFGKVCRDINERLGVFCSAYPQKPLG